MKKKTIESKDAEIIKKHKEMLKDIPPQFHKIYDNIKYYVLTQKGNDWVDIVAEQMKKRFKNGR